MEDEARASASLYDEEYRSQTWVWWQRGGLWAHGKFMARDKASVSSSGVNSAKGVVRRKSPASRGSGRDYSSPCHCVFFVLRLLCSRKHLRLQASWVCTRIMEQSGNHVHALWSTFCRRGRGRAATQRKGEGGGVV